MGRWGFSDASQSGQSERVYEAMDAGEAGSLEGRWMLPDVRDAGSAVRVLRSSPGAGIPIGANDLRGLSASKTDGPEALPVLPAKACGSGCCLAGSQGWKDGGMNVIRGNKVYGNVGECIHVEPRLCAVAIPFPPNREVSERVTPTPWLDAVQLVAIWVAGTVVGIMLGYWLA